MLNMHNQSINNINNNTHISTADSAKSTVNLPTISKRCDEITWDMFQKRWLVYKQNFNLNQEEIVQHLFQCCDGDIRNDIMKTFPQGLTGTEEELLITIKRFAIKSVAARRVELISLKQNHRESVGNFYLRIEKIAATCDYSVECCNSTCSQRFSFTSVIIKDILIAGLTNDDIKKEVLGWTELENKSINDIICFAEGKEQGHDFLPEQSLNTLVVSMPQTKNKTKDSFNSTKLTKSKKLSLWNTTNLIESKRNPITNVSSINDTHPINSVSDGSLRINNSVQIGKKQSKSNLCDEDFAVENVSVRDVKDFHKENSYKCTVCNEAFLNKKSLQEHIKGHIQSGGKGENPFTCGICSKSFCSNKSLERHSRIHTGVKPYICSVCNRCFTLDTTLRIHERIHTGEKPFSCKVCSKAFSDKSNLIRHSKVHTGDKAYKYKANKYKCTVCEESFHQKKILHEHVKVHIQNGENPYTCEICSKSFCNSYSLNIHSRIHTGIKPYVCKVCNKSFKFGTSLKIHKRIHTGEKPYSCDVCSKAFSDINNLTRHSRVHTGVKPYVCEICQKCYGQKFDLKRHEASHIGEKPYSCEVCGKKFNLKSDLQRHNDAMETCSSEVNSKTLENMVAKSNTHDSGCEKSYICKVCGKKYNQECDLLKHIDAIETCSSEVDS